MIICNEKCTEYKIMVRQPKVNLGKSKVNVN